MLHLPYCPCHSQKVIGLKRVSWPLYSVNLLIEWVWMENFYRTHCPGTIFLSLQHTNTQSDYYYVCNCMNINKQLNLLNWTKHHPTHLAWVLPNKFQYFTLLGFHCWITDLIKLAHSLKHLYHFLLVPVENYHQLLANIYRFKH